MSWLPFADTALPIGDLVYAAGILVLGTITYEVSDDISLDFASDEVDVAYSPPSPDNDDDDDYYDDDDNFGGRERVGKIKGNAPRNNKVQNQKFDYAARKAGIKVEKHRAFHDYMSGSGEGLDELLEMAKTFVSLVLIFL